MSVLKLENHFWATDGIYDNNYNKTQRQLNYEIEQNISTIENNLDNLKHNVKKWDVNVNGKIIFMGNSYAHYDGANPPTDAENWHKWPDWVAYYLGLGLESENENWWNIGYRSHCLANGVYLNDFNSWVNKHPTELNNIGAVILIGGLNDARPKADSDGDVPDRYIQVPDRLTELATRIKQVLPNAVLYNGYCGWVDEVARPADVRVAKYRMSVCKSYMESSKDGWNYLHGIENIIHNKKYLFYSEVAGSTDKGVHPNALGARRLGQAVVQALMTGSCSIVEADNVAPTTDGSVQSNTEARESQQNGIIYTLCNAFDFTFSNPKTFSRDGSTVDIGSINLKLSNYIDFGNQMVAIRDENNVNFPLLVRIFIKNGKITFQCKDFFDNSASKQVSRVVSFILTDTHSVMSD